MALSAIDKLKDKPKDEKTAVASGIAITVVIVLLVGWGIYFFKSVASGSQQVNLSGGVQDQFNFTSTKQAQQQLQGDYQRTQDQQDLYDVRNNPSNGGQMQSTDQQSVNVNGGTDAFGTGYSD